MNDILLANLISPITLCFLLGIATKLMRSEFSLPKEIYTWDLNLSPARTWLERRGGACGVVV
jgi:hypothetical protein